MNLEQTTAHVNNLTLTSRLYFCQSKITTEISRNTHVFSLVPHLTSWSVGGGGEDITSKQLLSQTARISSEDNSIQKIQSVVYKDTKNTKSILTYPSIFNLELQRPSKHSKECFIAAGDIITTQYPSHCYKWRKSHYFWTLTFLNAFISSTGVD